jgi:putative flippase GtrA
MIVIRASFQMLDKRVRYALVGGWNAFFSYMATVVLFYFLSEKIHIILLSILANLIAITMSFSTNKLFIFCTYGNWFREYIKSYVIYGGNILFGVVGLWLLSGILNVPVWISQAILLIIGVVFSFIGHSKFTFKN